MGYSHFDRLSATDAVFLELEDPEVHMHVGAVAIFEAGPLRRAGGGLDIERVRAYTDAALHESPRFRQRLASVPLLGHPVWVDDARFNLAYHVRHTALPAPGSIRQLKRLAGRIASQKLDRGKPLWEMWVVEGLEGDRFALIAKAHHCMVDGIAGIDLLGALLRLEPSAPEPAARGWFARPAPGPGRLLVDELLRRATLPLEIARRAPAAACRPREALAEVRESLLAFGETLQDGLVRTTATPLNVDIGPFRRIDWTQLEISAVREVRKHLGGTLNDVVLAIVSGAVRGFLTRRGIRPDRRTRFRAMVPVSIRGSDERGVAGNRVVNLLADLPVDEADPRARLERVIETMGRVKRSRFARGAEAIEELSDRTFPGIVTQFLRLAVSQRAYNLVVTNVPGPPVPVYLLGARMHEIHPLTPLFRNQALGVALFSYAGRLCWGLNADWDALPDLHDFALEIDAGAQALLEAARGAQRAESERGP